jgi:hypothetical protein
VSKRIFILLIWIGLIFSVGASVVHAQSKGPKRFKTTPGITPLKNHRLFKVDPAGALVHELRCVVEHRFGTESDFFWVLYPYVHHQNATGFSQKYYGAGFRFAVRKYFAWKKIKNRSPQGLFFQPMAGYKFTSITQYGEFVEVLSRTPVHQPSVGFTGGYQWLYGRTDNLAYGFTFGLEYFGFFPFRKNSIAYEDIKENWYQFPFSFKPSFLNGLRLYIGIELGFAFRQKDLHW